MKVDFYLKCKECQKDYIVQNIEIEDNGTLKDTINKFVNNAVPCSSCGNDKKNKISVLDIVWSKKNENRN